MYTITIPNLESVAFLDALLATETELILESLKGGWRQLFVEEFPGGMDSAIKLSEETETIDLLSVYHGLNNILDDAGITSTEAPWLEPKLPSEINDETVKYSDKGVDIGCVNLSLEEMELMVKEVRTLAKCASSDS